MKIKKGLPRILSIILGLTILLSITQTAFAGKSKWTMPILGLESFQSAQAMA